MCILEVFTAEGRNIPTLGGGCGSVGRAAVSQSAEEAGVRFPTAPSIFARENYGLLAKAQQLYFSSVFWHIIGPKFFFLNFKRNEPTNSDQLIFLTLISVPIRRWSPNASAKWAVEVSNNRKNSKKLIDNNMINRCWTGSKLCWPTQRACTLRAKRSPARWSWGSGWEQIIVLAKWQIEP